MILKKQRKLIGRLDNKGSAIVMAIIAIAFIGILVALVGYTALFNLHMKMNNVKTKDNFYSAEAALEEIRAGLEKDVSDTISAAYQKVLVSFSAMSADEKRASIRYDYFKGIQNIYAYSYIDGAGVLIKDESAYSLSVLGGYLSTTASGATLEAKMADDTYSSDYGLLVLYEDGVKFKDLRITYRNSEGYVSIIETDIKLKMPDLEFAQTASLPSLSDFSVIAQENLVTATSGTNTIGGSMYAKEIKVGGDATGADVNLHFGENAASPVTNRRVVVKNNINIVPGASVTSDEYGELWTGGIAMNGNGNLELNGNDVYLQDDITIEGKDNNVKIGAIVDGRYSGSLIGYGNGFADLEDGSNKEASSAIIINGTGTDIDLLHVTNLSLAGNTYIDMYSLPNTFASNTNVEEGYLTDKYNLAMGQSIAVKSDQLAYLVPAECIAIANSNAGAEKAGKTVLENVSNPITREQYIAAFFSDGVLRGDVDKVDLDLECESLGGRALRTFGIDESDVRVYAHQLNNKTTLYYFYIAFSPSSETDMINASNYLETYYKTNKEVMDSYQSIYTDSVKLRNPETSFYTLHLAGNLIHTDDAGEHLLQTDTLLYDRYNSEYRANLESYSTKFHALCLKMVDVFAQLTSAEKEMDGDGNYKKDAYSNIVNEKKIDDFVNDATAALLVGPVLFGEDGSAVRGVVTKGSYTYDASSGFSSGIIIATGDVSVEAPFAGAIISGGSIYLDNGISVKPDNSSVRTALTYKKTVNGKEYQYSDFLIGGSGYLSGENRYFDTNSISISELIVYENWEKK